MTLGLFWYKSSPHKDKINPNHIKQLLIFRYYTNVFVSGFYLRKRLISIFQRLSRIYREFVWKAMI